MSRLECGRVAAQTRQREALKRRQRRARSARSGNSDTVSLRSDMRSTDSPATIIDTIQQRARAPTSGPASDMRKRDR